MSATRFIVTTIAATLSGAVLLAGCGGGDDDAAPASAVASSGAADASGATPAPKAAKPYEGQKPVDIYNAMVAKMKKAKSVHLVADIKDSGGRIRMNVRINRSGKANGSLSLPADGSMKVILNGNKGWFKGGEDMYAKLAGGNSALTKRLAGQWVAFRKGGDMDDVWALANMKAFTDDSFTAGGTDGDVTKVKGKKLAGRETIGLKLKGDSGVVYVAADGSAELAGVNEKGSTITYSDWNKPVKTKAPAGAVDIKDFK